MYVTKKKKKKRVLFEPFLPGGLWEKKTLNEKGGVRNEWG